MTEIPCPECGNDSWNELGCMTCGLEFFPPSEAYQNASALSVSERAEQLRADLAPAAGVKSLPASASPIEKQFWEAHLRLALPALHGLVPQHPVGRYRIDFALPDRKTGIELDGFRSHSSTADITRDRQRQRSLEAQGWHIIRFGGSEVHRDAGRCVREAAKLAARMTGERPHD